MIRRTSYLSATTCVMFVAFVAVAAQAEEQNTMPPVPPTVEEVLQKNKTLIGESDLVAKLRVESVDRYMSYGGMCIEIRSSWYIARCRVLKTLYGKAPDDGELVDIIFWTKTNATILDFYLPPNRRKHDGFANQVKLDRRPAAKGKPEPMEFVAFLRGAPSLTPLKLKGGAPKLYAPTPSYQLAENAMTSLGRYQVVRSD